MTGMAKRIGAFVPVSCCQLADAGVEGAVCDHGPVTPYKPPKFHALRVRWAKIRKWVALHIYPDIHEDCEGW